MFPPKVLSFDLDDTLWPVAPVIALAEIKLLDWLKKHYPRSVMGHDIHSMRIKRAAVVEQFPAMSHDFTFLRRQSLAQQLTEAGYAETIADDAMEVFFSARNRVTFYPDVTPALRRLQTRYRLFAISNGNADLGRCGIANFFEGAISARDAGVAKPDARIFAQLLLLSGVAAHEVLHIGDDPLADVVGATRAGMQAVWLNRDGRDWPQTYDAPLRTVTSLDPIV